MTTLAPPVGPVDLAVFSFAEPGSRPVIADLIDGAVQSGAARVLDAIWISKSADGVVTVVDVGEGEGETAGRVLGFDVDLPGLIGEEDATQVAATMADGSAAAVVAWENAWVSRVGEAIDRAGGVLLSHDRIPAGAVNEVLAGFDERDPKEA